MRGYFSMFQSSFNTHACKSSTRQVQDSKKLVGKDQMFMNNLQVKRKTCLAEMTQYTCMQVKCKTKKICSERKRNCQKKNRLRGYFSIFQLNFNTHACKSSARPKIYVQNSKILFGKDRMFINNLQVKCKTCLP